MRPLAAFLISPLSAIALALLIGFRTSADVDLVYAIMGVVVFIYPVLLFFQLIVAAPLRWYLARAGWCSIWIDGGLGGVAFGLPAAAYAELAHIGLGSESVDVKNPAAAAAIASLFGLVTGLSYGLLRLRDRQASLHPTTTELASRFD